MGALSCQRPREAQSDYPPPPPSVSDSTVRARQTAIEAENQRGLATAIALNQQGEATRVAQLSPATRVEPTRAPAPQAQRQEVRIRKSPQELYRALLSTQPLPEHLPSEFVTRGNQVGNLDITARAFNAIGQANILISDNDPRFAGQPNAALTYVVFPNSLDAKGAFDTVKTQASKTPQGFDYPAVFTAQDFLGSRISMCVVLVDNIFVGGLLTTISSSGVEDTIAEDRTISLAKAAIEHLKKVAR